jgi:uncharacterized low-complexity protein
MNVHNKTALTLALTGALGAALTMGAANAAENLFASQTLSSGYMVAAAEMGADGKAKEGKCGEGKCGANKDSKSMEGKCGADKAKEGTCGGADKAKEGKCGEGKCGADKK